MFERALVGFALVVAVGIVLTVWRLQSGEAADASSVATASRGDISVSVGGVGRIVEARASGQIAVPASSAGSQGSASPDASAGSSGGGPSSAPVDAVFPLAAGRLSKFLVAPGQHVAAGEALALLDDGGSAAGTVLQAQNELATAQLELRQKRTSDPLNGLPPTSEEVAAAEMAVVSAQKRVAQLLGPSTPADVSTARSDLRRAEADLEALLGGTPAERAAVISMAQTNVQAAQQRLETLLALPSPADVAAAELDLRRAEADLADLLRADPPPSPEALAAARQAVVAARLRLAKVSEPADPADVTAARLEVQRSHADLRRLQAGPSPRALAAARQAADAARAKLAGLLGPRPGSDVAAARLDLRRAEADLAVLRARGGPATTFDIGLARLKVEAAQARHALARFTARQLTVRSPSDGTVTGLLTVPGAPVDTTTPVATVTGDRFAVSVDLSEFDVAQVKLGMKAVVSVDALGGKSFPGEVLFAALTGNDTGGVVTFPVQVSLARAAGLRPGMNVSVRIIVAERSDVVQVPLEAVSRDEEDRPFATVVDESGETATRPLVLGLANNKSVEVVKGLKAGEQVELVEVPEEGGGEE